MSKKNIPPLVLEELQSSANNLYFTLIEYKKETYLAIIDNIQGSEIIAFVLDMIGPESVDVTWFTNIANLWYYKSSNKYPLSYEFDRLGHKQKIIPILKSFNIDFVSRMVGKVFVFDVDKKPKVKRKRVGLVPSSVEIKFKKSNITIKSGETVDLTR